jgi:hypothetical protein
MKGYKIDFTPLHQRGHLTLTPLMKWCEINLIILHLTLTPLMKWCEINLITLHLTLTPLMKWCEMLGLDVEL